MTNDQIWALVPAAGAGRRMGTQQPKQYLPLAGRTVIEWALEPFVAEPRVAGLVVVVAADDQRWPAIGARLTKLVATPEGGAERARSVGNGLKALESVAAASDWVLVHDAARPCLRPADLERLIEAVRHDGAGGLLGVPVTDTVKRAEHGRVTETVAREGLWRALTPQMFRLGELAAALEKALADGVSVTDEASAMERAGMRPLVVEGHGDNLKVTVPADLRLAEIYLAQQRGEN